MQIQATEGIGALRSEALLPSLSQALELAERRTEEDQARRMQVYAAMIDRVDQNLRQTPAKIKALGEEDNTLIMFASDNGSSAEAWMSGTGEVQFTYPLVFATKGQAKRVEYSVSLFWKNLSHEGGICTPFIAYWPEVITRQRENQSSTEFTLVDIMATVSNITGASYPTSFNGRTNHPLARAEPVALRSKERCCPSGTNPSSLKVS